MLGGVAAGIARTYGIDVTLVRVLFVIAGVLWIGVPAYIVAWIAIAPADGPVAPSDRRRDPKMIMGLALVALGALIAGDRVLPNGLHFGHLGVPVLLIGGGLAILLLRRRDDDAFETTHPSAHSASAHSASAHSEGPRDPSASDVPSARPSFGTATEAIPRAASTSFAGETPQAEAPTAPPAVPPSAWTQTAPWPSPPSARARRRASRYERRAQRPRPFLTPLTLSVLLIGAGIASLLQATGALDVNLTVVLAIATCVVGVALVTAAFFGRAHTLILVGLVLLAATAISNTIDVPLRGGIGDRTYRPLQVAELQGHYQLGIGKLEIDLRDVPLAGRTTVVDAQAGIGEVLVFVPSTVRVEVHAHAGAGGVRLFGRETGGWPENDERAIDGTGPGVLQLNLRVGAGEVNVRRFEPGGIETIVGIATTGEG
jgi:phage shock protein PspC (stress-responsive transcriptional regulator)/predicted membrane protein